MEDKAIEDGLKNLKDSTYYDNLFYSALCRQRADWLVGINFTRFFTASYKSDKPLNIGRVQTPTLAMLTERQNKIDNFVKEKFYTIDLHCGTFKASSEKISDKSTAESLKNSCESKAIVKQIDICKKYISPPKLYDLTSLQREANRLFGFTANQTLDLLQNLYENKLATYPRTDSRYITHDMKESVDRLIKKACQKISFLSDNLNFDSDLIINDKKVSDHYAVLPTEMSVESDLDRLPESEKKIIYLLFARLLEAVGEKHIYEQCTAKIINNDVNFTVSGKTVISNGWKDIESKFKKFISLKAEESDEDEEASLPKLCEGDELECKADLSEHFTSPPKPYTEDTLLSAMEKAGNEDYESDEVERKGLGTSATRSKIIENLISRGYAERKGKTIIPTKNGINLISVVPEELKSAKMTADWENKLLLISKGEFDRDVFMENITNLVKNYLKKTIPKSDIAFTKKESIGKCPRCGESVVEGKYNFYCTGNKCDFALWKKNKFFGNKKKEITKSIAMALLKDGKVFVKDLYSEVKNKTYDAYILLDDNGKYVNFKLEFEKYGGDK